MVDLVDDDDRDGVDGVEWRRVEERVGCDVGCEVGRRGMCHVNR